MASFVGFGNWQSKPAGGEWFPYPIFIAGQIESAYQQGQRDYTFELVRKDAGFREGDPQNMSYTVDFGRDSGVMRQFCVQNPCRERQVRRIQPDERLTIEQLKAINHVEMNAFEACGPAKEGLMEKYGRDAYLALQDWIGVHALILVHIRFDNPVTNGILIDALQDDEYYRNLFEVHIGRGSTDKAARAEWEGRVFGDAYDRVTAFDRPKYGTINLTNDPRGVQGAAAFYGASFFVLKKDVTWRCTLTVDDSSSSDALPFSPRECSKMCERLESREKERLQMVMEHKGDASDDYREVQIHGPLRFDRDIAYCVGDERLSADVRAKVNKFASKHNFEVRWRSDLYGRWPCPPPF